MNVRDMYVRTNYIQVCNLFSRTCPALNLSSFPWKSSRKKQNDMQNIRIVETAGKKVVCQQMSLDDLSCTAVNREVLSLVCLLLTLNIPSVQSLSCSPHEDNAECQLQAKHLYLLFQMQ